MDNNLIVLKSAYGKTAQQTYHILPCKDPKTGDFPENVRPCTVDAQGHIQMILSEKDLNDRSKGKVFIPADVPIVVQHNSTFDLNNPIDAAKWEAIKNSKLIADDRLSRDSKGNYVIDGEQVSVATNGMARGRYGLADLYVEHPGVMAKTKNDFRKLVAKAMNMISEDSLDGMIKKCRLLEKDMSHANSNDVEDFLFSQAEKTPHIVIRRDNLLIYADNIVLGSSIDSAVSYLTNPTGVKIKDLIMRETYPELFTEKENKNKK